jgi:hypothetical protein
MRKITTVAIIIILALVIGGIYCLDSVLIMPSSRLQAWEETFTICKQFCIDKGGEYSNHEPIFVFNGEKIVANGVKCECKNIGNACMEKYCFEGKKEVYELKKEI